jgi:hypothetical protein
MNHLPECPMLDEQWPKHPLEKCPYCDMISACEQRVLNLNPIAIGVLIAQRSRERALDAVRESVERLPAHGRVAYSLAVSKAKVIEAIDALREKP